MKLPRLDADTKAFYDRILPPDPRIETRAMFGGLGSFVKGNMFAGALGTKIFLRFPEPDLHALLREPGGGAFEPVPGHAMAGYATLPEAWRMDARRAESWGRKAFDYVASLPPKPTERRKKK